MDKYMPPYIKQKVLFLFLFYFTKNLFKHQLFWDNEKILHESLKTWLAQKEVKHNMLEVWQSLKNEKSSFQTS